MAQAYQTSGARSFWLPGAFPVLPEASLAPTPPSAGQWAALRSTARMLLRAAFSPASSCPLGIPRVATAAGAMTSAEGSFASTEIFTFPAPGPGFALLPGVRAGQGAGAQRSWCPPWWEGGRRARRGGRAGREAEVREGASGGGVWVAGLSRAEEARES